MKYRIHKYRKDWLVSQHGELFNIPMPMSFIFNSWQEALDFVRERIKPPKITVRMIS